MLIRSFINWEKMDWLLTLIIYSSWLFYPVSLIFIIRFINNEIFFSHYPLLFTAYKPPSENIASFVN